jgi:transcription termination factor Rho
LTVDDIESVNGMSKEAYLDVKPLESLTAIDPQKAIRFETEGGPLSMRVVDLMTPIGFGQRGLLVASPRTGKTVLLQQMAAGVAANHPAAYMIVLLIDERPEEVTDMRRTVHGEVVASCNDQNVASHVRVARIVIEKAKRLVECKRDVVVLLDSLTRMGRAFNARIQGGGRIMSGGLDIRALAEPKSIFGAARNVEEGGSLTIIATCLIDTGSRMDEVIFNEFKGTGNMEIMLSRDLANRRIWPAIDLNLSGTRKEERLLSPQALQVSHRIRRTLLDKDPAYPMEILLEQMGKCRNNREFITQFGETVFR